ncbi:MAG: cyclic nucleotide-binding domain-containing protein [Ardenticatenales bacterium]|nr:cyclic nucleotide-binding domain-containing protein [Ardenticatenales bacterium]
MPPTPPDDSPPIDPTAVTGPVAIPGAAGNDRARVSSAAGAVGTDGATDVTVDVATDASEPRTDGLTDADVALHLLGTEVFQLLPAPALRQLAPLFRATRVRAGEVIARQGTVDTTLWVLIGGTLVLERIAADGETEAMGHREYGSVVGIRGVFTDVPRPSSVVAETDAWLLAADRDDVLRLLRADPEIDDLLVLPDDARANMEARREEETTEGEYEVRVYRRHVLALIRGMVLPAGLLVVALVVGAGAAAVTADPVAILAWAVIGLGVPAAGAWWSWLNWSEDRLIVTNQRVIMIETRPFITAARREALMARVQDVQARSPSIMARLFDYGTVTINTASNAGKIVWHMAGRPDALRAVLFDQMHRARDRAQAERRSWIDEQLRKAIGDGRLASAEAPSDGAADRPAVPSGEVRQTAPPTWFGSIGRLILYFLPRPEERQGTTYVWRKHWWILLRATAMPLALAAAATWLLASGIAVAADESRWATRAAVGLAVGAYGWLWWRYEDWRNDQYILTANHVLDIESLPLGLFKEQRQASLDAVQDVRYSIPNPVAMVLRYGTVTIQTAADTGNFSFTDIANPARVQGLIFERINDRRARLEVEAEQKRADEMVRWLAAYHGMTTDQGPPPAK